MLRTIGIALMLLSGVAVTSARAEDAPPKVLPAECRKIDRCIPTRDELDGKAVQDRKTKIRHDTVKNSINNVR